MANLLGTFEQIVLLAVLGLNDDAYGRAVLHEVQVTCQRGASSAGAVYATLDRLEAKGLLTSRLEQGTPARGGRARRFYHVTAFGTHALRETHSALERAWHGKRWAVEVTT